MQYEWINNVAKMSSDYTIIHFHENFNQGIDPNTLPKKLTTLTFGWMFNQGIDPNTLPKNLTSITFGKHFNQKINPNTLPENLTTLTFGCYFNQKINSKMLPYNLKNINFDWMCCNKHTIEMVNNIPSYYHVEILVINNIFIFGNDGIKWPIYVLDYNENK